MQTIAKYAEQINRLPPGPRILSRLLTLLGRPDLDSTEIIHLISFDPALTSRILQRCNSALYGFEQPIYTLAEALVALGYNEIYRIVATVLGEATLKEAQWGYGMAPGELWEHSATTAVAARIIARTTNADENMVFTAALLHDIGKLILNSSLEGKYHELVHETEIAGCTLLETEKLLLGIEHAELGGAILEVWNFPDSLARTVRFHHDPLHAESHQTLAACVHLADLVAHLAGRSQGYQSFAVRAECEPARLLGMQPRDFESIVLETEEKLAENPLFTRA